MGVITKMTNEFETIQNEVYNNDNAQQNEQDQNDELLVNNERGVAYDYKSAPQGVSRPPRVDLDDQTVTITKSELFLPPESKPWLKTKDGTKEYKPCVHYVHYDKDNQVETLSGWRVFKDETTGKYRHPTFDMNGESQIAKVYRAFAKKKGINLDETKFVDVAQFLAYLDSKPQVRITKTLVKNPETKEEVHKNLPTEFL